MDKVTKSICRLLPSNKIDVFGKDSLLNSTFPYYLLPLITLFVGAIHIKTQNSFLILFILYAFIPLLDEFFSLDERNPTKSEYHQLEKSSFKFQLPVYLIIILDWIFFYYGLLYCGSYEITWTSWPNLFGFIIIMVSLNAAEFAVAHEIMHKPGFRRTIGTWHMIKTLNIHFTNQHLLGHHRNVATPEDPASAAKDINVYQFFIRSYFGAYQKVYERDRQSGKPLYRNTIFISILSSIVFCSFIYYVFGLQAFSCFLMWVSGAVFYLEVINYIEHYGLRRKKDANGDYEKVTVRHSWNSPHRFSNYLFFKLQRHSDHHENSMKPYQTLLSIEESAQLPHGYIIMTVMAFFPQTFYKIMNPLVDQYAKHNENNEEVKEVFVVAVQQARQFVVQIAILTLSLFFMSKLI